MAQGVGEVGSGGWYWLVWDVLPGILKCPEFRSGLVSSWGLGRVAGGMPFGLRVCVVRLVGATRHRPWRGSFGLITGESWGGLAGSAEKGTTGCAGRTGSCAGPWLSFVAGPGLPATRCVVLIGMRGGRLGVEAVCRVLGATGRGFITARGLSGRGVPSCLARALWDEVRSATPSSPQGSGPECCGTRSCCPGRDGSARRATRSTASVGTVGDRQRPGRDRQRALQGRARPRQASLGAHQRRGADHDEPGPPVKHDPPAQDPRLPDTSQGHPPPRTARRIQTTEQNPARFIGALHDCLSALADGVHARGGS